MSQMRCGQSISGALLCSDSGCPDTASLLSFCEHLPSHIPWFSAKLPEGSSLGQQRPNTWYAASLPLSPATHVPQRPILYKGKQAAGDCEGGWWQAETDYLLWYRPLTPPPGLTVLGLWLCPDNQGTCPNLPHSRGGWAEQFWAGACRLPNPHWPLPRIFLFSLTCTF